jgi:4-hydroxy-tetrahydrodipicolinate synthase
MSMPMISSEKKELMERLKGVSVPMVTPLAPTGDIDETGLRKNIRYLIRSGISEGNGFLLLLGTTGEFSNLTRDEAHRIVAIGVEECKGKVPLIAGVNHSNIKDAVEFGKFAASLGIDAILVRPPYYWGVPSEEMILKHYDEIAREVPVGIVIYNRCLSYLVDIPIPILLKLSEMEQVVALKDGTPDFRKFDRTIKELSGRISCINGFGEIYEPYSMLMGSTGFLSCAANFIPGHSLKLFSLAQKGDYIGAEKIHRSLMPLLNTLFSGTYGQFIELTKYAMEISELSGGPVRDPLPRATSDQKRAVRHCLEELGVSDS